MPPNRLAWMWLLKVGAVSEQVTVTGAPPVVNTVTANEGNTITGQQVNSLPLTNRVFTQLMSLEPGVSMPVVVDPGFGSNSSVNFSVNGVRDDENNLLIDGVRNADTFGGNAFVTPNLFAVSEVRIDNNDYTATAGRSAGAQVNLVTRSGTNKFHGDVFEFFRNNAFNAENYFSTSSPEDRHNDFGYDVGGPIKKDRLFFFWSQEWRRIVVNSGPAIAVAPTADERAGNFSESLIQPIDPTTGQPFPNNTIPSGRIDPNATLLLSTHRRRPGEPFGFRSPRCWEMKKTCTKSRRVWARFRRTRRSLPEGVQTDFTTMLERFYAALVGRFSGDTHWPVLGDR